jgi:hypothetical protein
VALKIAEAEIFTTAASVGGGANASSYSTLFGYPVLNFAGYFPVDRQSRNLCV